MLVHREIKFCFLELSGNFFLILLIWDWLNMQMMKATCNSCLNETYLMHIFSVRHITTFLHFGTLDSILAVYLRVTFSREITTKAQKCENMALNRSWEKCLFILWDLKKEGRALPSLISCNVMLVNENFSLIVMCLWVIGKVPQMLI